MLRFEGEVFLFGTAIAAPLNQSTNKKLRRSAPGLNGENPAVAA
jgi:hypothetical protein